MTWSETENQAARNALDKCVQEPAHPPVLPVGDNLFRMVEGTWLFRFGGKWWCLDKINDTDVKLACAALQFWACKKEAKKKICSGEIETAEKNAEAWAQWGEDSGGTGNRGFEGDEKEGGGKVKAHIYAGQCPDETNRHIGYDPNCPLHAAAGETKRQRDELLEAAKRAIEQWRLCYDTRDSDVGIEPHHVKAFNHQVEILSAAMEKAEKGAGQ